MKANEKELDIQKTLELIRAGDQKAFLTLNAAYEPLLRAEVAHYTVGLDSFHVEDFYQVALIALYRAALKFNLAQCKVEFGLYAKICISHALASQLRTLINYVGVLSDDEPIDGDDNGEDDPARRIMEEEAVQTLLARISQILSAFENRVWNLHMAGISAKEISRVVGKDVHSIENAVYRIRRKLRKALSEGD